MIRVEPGRTPLVISLPHAGRGIPPAIAARMTPRALEVVDTDWHVERLYEFARAAGAAWVEPTLSRYVVDLNRPPDDAALYPGQVSTGLCPAETFSGEPLYTGAPPDPAEIAERRRAYWQPYHDALRELIEAARRRHGHAIVLDGHSIRSAVPRLFTGRLPDINLGTHDGRACEPRLAAAVVAVCAAQSRFSHVLNGRFKGGYITRHYGQPADAVQALQIELAQSSYMDETGTGYDPGRAAPLVAVLQQVVATLLEFRPF
ncbi:MAG: N-formylglutamate deformylase [Proteobacteria bacterium]|nr:N-formylglutamate deformylase [Pseudomonadota bacterium]